MGVPFYPSIKPAVTQRQIFSVTEAADCVARVPLLDSVSWGGARFLGSFSLP